MLPGNSNPDILTYYVVFRDVFRRSKTFVVEVGPLCSYDEAFFAPGSNFPALDGCNTEIRDSSFQLNRTIATVSKFARGGAIAAQPRLVRGEGGGGGRGQAAGVEAEQPARGDGADLGAQRHGEVVVGRRQREEAGRDHRGPSR